MTKQKTKMGNVLAVPEQAIAACNGYQYDTYYVWSLYIDVSSMLKSKKPHKNFQFGTFWTSIEQTSHCGKYEMNETMNKLKKNCLHSN